MNGWDRLGEWLATLALASLPWVSGMVGGETPVREMPLLTREIPSDERFLMIGWAQTDDQPPIEQVGEDGADSETLDEGASQADTTGTSDDVESLDAGSPPETDVETLDQGPAATAAPATETAPAAPSADTTVTNTEPVAAKPSGPVVPPGFGTGRVHVVAGRSEMPAGLEECHVGAVTGRAYVGIDCGENEAAFVGHAPSFQDFPFVVEGDFPFGEGNSPFDDPNFPFGDDSPFTVSSGSGEGNGSVVVSSAQKAEKTRDKGNRDPEITTTGDSSVRLSQRARRRDGRVHAEEQKAKRSKDSGKRRNEQAGDESKGKGDKRASANSDKRNGGEVSVEQKSEKKKDTKRGKHRGKGKDGKRDRAADQEPR